MPSTPSHPPRSRVRASAICLAATIAAASACATTGATYRSGVGDSFHDRPPYRAGATPGIERAGIPRDPPGGLPARRVAAAELRSRVRRRVARNELVAEMNRYLDSLVHINGGVAW